MSIATAKYLLWGLLCVPVVFLAIYGLVSLIKDNSAINKKAQRESELLKQQLDEKRQSERRKQLFDIRYKEHLDRKYGDGRNL